MNSTTDGVLEGVLPALTNGTFPSSEELLKSELSTTTIPSLLESIQREKRNLEDDIRSTSRDQSSDVDEWIYQAKKVQEDIARCKIAAAEIVREHKQIEGLKSIAHDARSKFDLLRGEIEFTAFLQQELEAIGVMQGQLIDVQASLDSGFPIKAASQLHALEGRTSVLRSENARYIIEDRLSQCRHDTHLKLEAELESTITFQRNRNEATMVIGSDSTGEGRAYELRSGPVKPRDLSERSPSAILAAMQSLGTLQSAIELLAGRIERCILLPLVSPISQEHAITIETKPDYIAVHLGSSRLSPRDQIDLTRQTIKFLYTNLPDLAVEALAEQLMPRLVSSLISNHLTPSIPMDLTEMSTLQDLQEIVTLLANDLKSFRWPGYNELQDWISQLPYSWLDKRKMVSLHGIRIALSMARGPSRQVERVERQTVSKEDSTFPVHGATDDWDAGWEEDVEDKPVQPPDEDDVSGWGFDQSNSPDRPKQDRENDGTEESDSWGWEEDNPEEDRKPPSPRTTRRDPVNGDMSDPSSEREITLAETYTVTDIPDHVLKIISKDVQDAKEVQKSTYNVLHSASPSSGLLALPTHVLAMFRAMATTYYTTDLPTGNMRLYNDSLYIVQKLCEPSALPNGETGPAVESDCSVMARFARAAYAREMDIQRTILGDILDGAQGFTNCTQSPYAMQCETAVTSATDRIRAMHSEWRPILSNSALLQSIGSLVSAMTTKITADVLDMEDISEPESQRLASFCVQVSGLNELFLAETPAQQAQSVTEIERVPLTAVYVPSWLRFQYMANILESSLVDIKYLWTEGELRMEFSADEVVDLIRALFAESRYRREAIAEIRS